VAEVFGFFLALDETAPKVDPSIESIVKTPNGPPGSGTTFRFRQRNLGTRESVRNAQANLRIQPGADASAHGSD
jgi:hypothetical protein